MYLRGCPSNPMSIIDTLYLIRVNNKRICVPAGWELNTDNCVVCCVGRQVLQGQDNYQRLACGASDLIAIHTCHACRRHSPLPFYHLLSMFVTLCDDLRSVELAVYLVHFLAQFRTDWN